MPTTRTGKESRGLWVGCAVRGCDLWAETNPPSGVLERKEGSVSMPYCAIHACREPGCERLAYMNTECKCGFLVAKGYYRVAHPERESWRRLEYVPTGGWHMKCKKHGGYTCGDVPTQ